MIKKLINNNNKYFLPHRNYMFGALSTPYRRLFLAHTHSQGLQALINYRGNYLKLLKRGSSMWLLNWFEAHATHILGKILERIMAISACIDALKISSGYKIYSGWLLSDNIWLLVTTLRQWGWRRFCDEFPGIRCCEWSDFSTMFSALACELGADASKTIPGEECVNN